MREKWVNRLSYSLLIISNLERFFAVYDQPTREEAEAAYFAWMDTIPPELYATYTPLMLTIEEWGDEIFSHFDQDRITGAFVEGACKS